MAFPVNPTLGQIFTHDGENFVVIGLAPLTLAPYNGVVPPFLGTTNPTLDEYLLQIVVSSGANTPPSHVANQRHVVGTAPTGAWAGQDRMIAVSDGSAWAFIQPWTGLETFLLPSGPFSTFNATDWLPNVQNTTITNTVAVPNGVYGDVTVTGNNWTVTGGTGGGSGGTAINGTAGVEWFDPAGFATLTGPSQVTTFPHSAPLPFIPGQGRFWLDIDVTGQPFQADALEMQFSFDDGLTWPATSQSGSGIPGERRMLAIGAQQMPLEYVGNLDEFLWFSISPVPTPTGLKYRFVTQGYYDVVTSGPIGLRLISHGFMPAATSIKILGVHFK